MYFVASREKRVVYHDCDGAIISELQSLKQPVQVHAQASRQDGPSLFAFARVDEGNGRSIFESAQSSK